MTHWNMKHGFSSWAVRGPEYKTWRGMNQRCSNPKNPSFGHYGARGIRVCERWRDFVNFLSDMGERPGSGYSIDRIDPNGHYEPGNCRWATVREQARSKRSNRWIEFGGKRQLAIDWARDLGVSPDCIRKRLREWPLERALTEGKRR